MVECSRCCRWWHCVCAGVAVTKARSPHYTFACTTCGSVWCVHILLPTEHGPSL